MQLLLYNTTTLYHFNLDCSLRYLAQVFFDNSRNLGESRQLSDFLRMDDLDNIFDLEVPKLLNCPKLERISI